MCTDFFMYEMECVVDKLSGTRLVSRWLISLTSCVIERCYLYWLHWSDRLISFIPSLMSSGMMKRARDRMKRVGLWANASTIQKLTPVTNGEKLMAPIIWLTRRWSTTKPQRLQPMNSLLHLISNSSEHSPWRQHNCWRFAILLSIHREVSVVANQQL